MKGTDIAPSGHWSHCATFSPNACHLFIGLFAFVKNEWHICRQLHVQNKDKQQLSKIERTQAILQTQSI
jgi:hypothetical protein